MQGVISLTGVRMLPVLSKDTLSVMEMIDDWVFFAMGGEGRGSRTVQL
jgi:hypothetical protein